MCLSSELSVGAYTCNSANHSVTLPNTLKRISQHPGCAMEQGNPMKRDPALKCTNLGNISANNHLVSGTGENKELVL